MPTTTEITFTDAILPTTLFSKGIPPICKNTLFTLPDLQYWTFYGWCIIMIPSCIVGYAFIDKRFSLRTLHVFWTSTIGLLWRRKPKKPQELKSEKVIAPTSRTDPSITKVDKDKPATDSQDAVETDQPHGEACAAPRFVECLVEAFVRTAQVLLMQIVIVSKLSSTDSNHCNVVAYLVIENAPLERIFVTLFLCAMDRQRLRVYQSGQCEKIFIRQLFSTPYLFQRIEQGPESQKSGRMR